MAGSHWSPTSKPSRTCGVNAEAAAPDSIGRKANAAPTTAARAIPTRTADLPAREEAHVRVHAAGRADDRLHVLRPVEAGRVDRALHPAAAGPDDVERHAADFLVFRALHG